MSEDIMSEYGELEEKLVALMNKARTNPAFDQRTLAIARTNFEQGRMWLVKSYYNNDHSGWNRPNPPKPVEEERFHDDHSHLANLGN